MKLAIMQPYFFPYVGYFQLIAAADLFIVYDNVKYTKKGWISRNRILKNGTPTTISLHLRRDSDALNVCDRELSANSNRNKLLGQISATYRKAPYFPETFPLITQVLQYEDTNLFRFIYHSIVKTCEHLGLATEIRISSGIAIDHELRSQDKVLALCKAVGAGSYVNAIGGKELYAKEVFGKKGVELKFIRSKPFEYLQFGDPFVPWLSIIDVMMFNPLDKIRDSIYNNSELI